MEIRKWPIIDPHSIVACLYSKKDGIEIPEEAVARFWEYTRANGELWALWSKASNRHIPIGIFGDGATIITKFGLRTSIAGIFLSFPLWRPKSTRMSRFLLLAIPESKLWHHYTLDRAYARIVWSLNLLYKGVHPHVGPGGEELPMHLKRLAGQQITSCGSLFTCTEVRGDWSWHKKVWRCLASWNGHHTCFHCPAKSIGPFSERYYNFESASWMDRQYTLPQFISKQLPDRGISALFASLFCKQCSHPKSETCCLDQSLCLLRPTSVPGATRT